MPANRVGRSETDALARRASDGDRQALDALLRQQASMAVRAAYLLLGNREDALDAAQQALCQAARGLSNEWSGRSFKSWLWSCARGAALDLIKADTRRARREKESAEACRESPMRPMDEMERAEAVEALRAELAVLEPELSMPVVLHHLEGLSVAQAAHHMGLSVDVCKQRLHRGREALRKRLQVRGVGLGAMAVSSDLLQTACDSARSWVERLEPKVLEALATQAQVPYSLLPTNDAKGKAPPSTSSREPYTEAPTFKKVSSGIQGAPVGVFERVIEMLKKHPYRSGGLVIGVGLMCLILLNASGRGQERPVPAANDTVAEAKAASKDGSKAVHATVAEARWQPPRFLEGAEVPVSIACAGKHAGVLTMVIDSEKKERPLLVIETEDGGQNWTKRTSLGQAPFGTLGMDSEGACAFAYTEVTEKPKEPSTIQSIFKAIANEQPRSLQWRYRESGKTFGVVRTILNAPEGEQFLSLPKVLLEDGTAWVFVTGKTKDNKMNVHVATGQRQNPNPVGIRFAGTCEGVPSAWALGAESAGIVLMDQSNKQLVHHTTENSGKNWDAIPIPFEPNTLISDIKVQNVLPLSLSRCGKRLVLLVGATGVPPGAQSNLELVRQDFVLTSEDLGQKWSAPFEAGPLMHAPFANRVGPKIHAMESAITICGMKVSMKGSGDLAKKLEALVSIAKQGKDVLLDPKLLSLPSSEIAVRVSEDLGRTWRLYHAFDALKEDSSFPVLGGDEASLHIGLLPGVARKSELNQRKPQTTTGSLVIRTLTRSIWEPVANPPPWYQHQDDPNPTPEDF